MAPRDITDVVTDVQHFLRRSEQKVVTLEWREYYRLLNVERIFESRTREIAAELKRRDILMVYGSHVVVFIEDKNSFPLPSEYTREHA